MPRTGRRSGVHNVNAQTGGMINGVRFVAETYTKQDLAKKILRRRPGRPEGRRQRAQPALGHARLLGLVGYQEMQDLVEYLFSLKPPGTKTKAKGDEW